VESVHGDQDELLSLAEACNLTGLTLAELQIEYETGHLRYRYRIGNKIFVTRRHLNDMLLARRDGFRGIVGNIYFAGYGPYIKIGFTKGPVEQRIRGLSVAAPEELVIYAVARGGVDDEKALHERFSHLHLRGEWFRHDGDLAAHVAAVRAAQPGGPEL
jgi:hypothetical protein